MLLANRYIFISEFTSYYYLFYRLPYTDACIMEIQRLGSIAPMAVPHRVLQDIEIDKYRIPKDTFVFSVLYHIMRDPDYWHDPEIFKPERFLNESGEVIKEERFIPFGVGKYNNYESQGSKNGKILAISRNFCSKYFFFNFFL